MAAGKVISDSADVKGFHASLNPRFKGRIPGGCFKKHDRLGNGPSSHAIFP